MLICDCYDTALLHGAGPWEEGEWWFRSRDCGTLNCEKEEIDPPLHYEVVGIEGWHNLMFLFQITWCMNLPLLSECCGECTSILLISPRYCEQVIRCWKYLKLICSVGIIQRDGVGISLASRSYDLPLPHFLRSLVHGMCAWSLM